MKQRKICGRTSEIKSRKYNKKTFKNIKNTKWTSGPPWLGKVLELARRGRNSDTLKTIMFMMTFRGKEGIG